MAGHPGRTPLVGLCFLLCASIASANGPIDLGEAEENWFEPLKTAMAGSRVWIVPGPGLDPLQVRSIGGPPFEMWFHPGPQRRIWFQDLDMVWVIVGPGKFEHQKGADPTLPNNGCCSNTVIVQPATHWPAHVTDVVRGRLLAQIRNDDHSLSSTIVSPFYAMEFDKRDLEYQCLFLKACRQIGK